MITEIATITDPFTTYSRGKTVIDQVVIHESVTSSRAKTVQVLRARKLGVHIIVDRDGSVTQHAPLATQVAHAGSKHNRRSVALEVVNRYYGSQGDEGDPDIAAVWAHRGWYILPTHAQLEAVWLVLMQVLALTPTIPGTFPGATKTRFAWGRLPAAQLAKVPAGIMAHHRTDHADGLFPEHYCLMRSLGHEPKAAYSLTLDAASAGKRSTPIVYPTQGASS